MEPDAGTAAVMNCARSCVTRSSEGLWMYIMCPASKKSIETWLRSVGSRPRWSLQVQRSLRRPHRWSCVEVERLIVRYPRLRLVKEATSELTCLMECEARRHAFWP